jgi:hypothetical protein
MQVEHLVGQPEQAVLDFLVAEGEMLDRAEHRAVVGVVAGQL